MKIQEKLLLRGQSLWMDDHSREFIHDGSLMRYIEEFSVTRLSLSPDSLRRTVAGSSAYDGVIHNKLEDGVCGEPLACSLVLDDIRYAADLLRHIHDRTDGVDGWAILPSSPLAMDNPATLTKVIADLSDRVHRPNTLISLPILPERLETIEELVCKGIPLNLTNIYSHDQYSRVAEACLKGIERRIVKGLRPVVPVFISIAIFRLETTLSHLMDRQMAADCAVAMAQKIYASMRTLHNSPRWERAYSSGARPLRLVWNCSCGDEDRDARLALASRLKAPLTVMTLPKQFVKSFISSMNHNAMPYDCDACKQVLDRCLQADFNLESIAAALQEEAVTTFRNSWIMMLEAVAKKSAQVSQQKNNLKQGDKV